MSRSLATREDPRTVLHRMAADRARAERIHDAKAARPDLTWAATADAVGVRERSAAQWQASGGITHENCMKLAAVLEVDPDYLWRGREQRATGNGTADLMGQLSGAAQLDRIEAMCQQILERLDAGASAAQSRPNG